MDILNSLKGAGSVQDILSDSAKVKQFLPILISLADTYKQEKEHAICAVISFEDNGKGETAPILRVVATKITGEGDKQQIVINRNIEGPNAEPLKFNLLELLVDHNKNEKKETK